jgi:acetyl esterase/lipase
MQAIEDVLRPYQVAYETSKDRTVLPRIVTIGHSLGGALAVIAALSILHKFPAYQARQIRTTCFLAGSVMHAG